jgi:type VI secretion system secreted protein VgrG
VRVSHPLAGKGFGMLALPRIGQEVIVDFLEGDPDQPIITGRVYNAEQMPPWELPANATQSGVLTRSSKGGAVANANAIRFEDKKGSEQLWIHAEKNQDIEVENDETHWVGHDRTKTIDHDETTHVKHDRTETVDNNETITIHANRTETVDAEEKITIGANRTESVGASETVSISASRSHSIGANDSQSVGASHSVTVGSSQSVTVGASRTDTIGGSVSQTIGGSYSQTVAGGIKITTPGAMTVSALGGIKFIAPGGTQFIDFQFEKIGGQNMATYGINIEGYTLHNETSAIATAQKGVSVEASVVKTAHAQAAIRKALLNMLGSDAAWIHKAGVALTKANIALFS